MHDDNSASQVSRIQHELEQLEKDAKKALKGQTSLEKIERIRVAFLGKKGKISEVLKSLGGLAVKDRPAAGARANLAKENVTALLDAALQRLNEAKRASILRESIDVSLPGRQDFRGAIHPLMQVAEEVLGILRQLGFDLVKGPEIEHDFYNFESLNVPKEHPARDMQDTFYVAKDVVLRTHTSPVQIRTLLKEKEAPVRVMSFGRVYRRDFDATHSPVFHQVEGLYVDKSVSFADLKGTLSAFVTRLFSKEAKIRLRPSYFPFTEPSAEVDMSCFVCKGDGCRLCKASGWIEILGSGMVDPEVFKAVGWDAEKYSGFAFGMGVERIAMLKLGVTDLRYFYENDLRFLRQF